MSNAKFTGGREALIARCLSAYRKNHIPVTRDFADKVALLSDAAITDLTERAEQMGEDGPEPDPEVLHITVLSVREIIKRLHRLTGLHGRNRNERTRYGRFVTREGEPTRAFS